MSNQPSSWWTSDQHLLHGLIGENWKSLYHTSAKFHHDVQTLAAMLPMWVEGIALRAAEHDEAQNRAIAASMIGGPPPRRFTTDEAAEDYRVRHP